MKKIFFIVVALLACSVSFGQRYYNKTESDLKYATKEENGAKVDTIDLVNPWPSIRDTITNISYIKDTIDNKLSKKANSYYPTFNGNASITTLGSELITNGTFTSDVSWTKSTGVTIGNGTLLSDGTGTAWTSMASQSASISIGKTYLISFTILTRTSGDVSISLGGYNGTSMYSSVGTFSTYLKITNGLSNSTVYIQHSAVTFIGSIDNFSVKEVIGGDLYVGGIITSTGKMYALTPTSGDNSPAVATTQFVYENTVPYFIGWMKDLGHNIISIPLGSYSLVSNAGFPLTDNNAFRQLYRVYKTETLTGFKFLQQTQGVYNSDQYNGIKIYSVSGTTATEVAGGALADDGTLWKAPVGLVTKALPSPITLQPGLYCIAFVWNTSDASPATIPKLFSFGNCYTMYGTIKQSSFVPSTNTLPSPSFDMNTGASTNSVVFAIWPY